VLLTLDCHDDLTDFYPKIGAVPLYMKDKVRRTSKQQSRLYDASIQIEEPMEIDTKMAEHRTEIIEGLL
jgi:hypothetical protein